MERTNRIPSTVLGSALIEAHMLRRSHDVAWDCKKRTAYTYKVATIRLLLKVLVTPAGPGPPRLFAKSGTRDAAPAPRPAPRTVLLVQRENHVDGGIDLDRLAVQQRGLVLPLLHGIHRGTNQQRMPREHFQRFHRAALGNDGVQTDRAGDARLAGKRRIHGLNFVEQQRRLDAAALSDTRGRRLRRGRASARATDHAADDATHRNASNATDH